MNGDKLESEILIRYLFMTTIPVDTFSHHVYYVRSLYYQGNTVVVIVIPIIGGIF